MPTADLHRWLIAATAAMTLQACAMSSIRGDAPFEISEDYANNVIRYTVQRGDRLSDIALEFTGNVSSWLPIAEHNRITDPKTLSVGTQIEIPTALIPGYEQERRARRSQRNGIDAKTADTTGEAASTARESGDPEPQAVQNDSETSPLLRTPTVIQANQSTETISESDSQARQGEAKVKVLGSYYPKGIYARPTLNSQLMLRATPGSDFALVELLDGWFRIQTDLGQGFLRARDGRVIDTDR